MDSFAEMQIRLGGTTLGQHRGGYHAASHVHVDVQPLDSPHSRAVLAHVLGGAPRPVRTATPSLAREALDELRALHAAATAPGWASRLRAAALRSAIGVFPALEWAPALTAADVRRDVVSGAVVGVMAVPQAMSYAGIAGLPLQYGLYSAIVPTLVYALFGRSPPLAVGPVAMVSLLLRSGLAGLLTEDECPAAYAPGETREQLALCPDAYVRLALLVALCAGALQLAASVLQLGHLVSFLGRPVIGGFTTAAALTIGLSQLGAFVGYSLGKDPRALVSLGRLLDGAPHANAPTLLLGLGACACLEAAKRAAARWPNRLGALRALAPLLLCVVCIGGVTLAPATAARWRVHTVGALPAGLPPWTGGALPLGRLRAALPAAVPVALIGFLESIAIAKALGAQHGYESQPTTELRAVGLANLAGALFGAFPVAGSFSRSAVASATGARTQLAGVVTAGLIALAVRWATGWFEALPHFALAAIVLSSVSSLVAWDELPALWRVKRADAALWLLAFGGTVALGVQRGILIAVVASLVIVVRESSRPQIAVLWRTQAGGKLGAPSDIYRPVEQEPRGEFVRAVLIVRIGGPLYFANCAYVRERLLELLDAFDAHGGVRYLVVEMTPVASLDSTALHALRGLLAELRRRGVCLGLATVGSRAEQTMRDGGLIDELGDEWVHANVHAAVLHCLRHARAADHAREAEGLSCGWAARNGLAPPPVRIAPSAFVLDDFARDDASPAAPRAGRAQPTRAAGARRPPSTDSLALSSSSSGDDGQSDGDNTFATDSHSALIAYERVPGGSALGVSARLAALVLPRRVLSDSAQPLAAGDGLDHDGLP